MSAFHWIVLQKSANERLAPKNRQYPNPNGWLLESKFPVQGLI
jgi:hypothetical protein